MKVYFVFVFVLAVLLSCSINSPFKYSDFDFSGPPEPIISGVTESRSYGEVSITVQPVEGVTHKTFIDGVEYIQDTIYDTLGSHIFQALARKDGNGLEVIKGIHFIVGTLPQLQNVFPVDGAYAVDETQDIILTFSMNIKSDFFGTVTLGETTFVNGSNCTMSVLDNVVTISPNPMLTPAKKYRDIEVEGFMSETSVPMDTYRDSQYDFTTYIGVVKVTNEGWSIFPRIAYNGSQFGIIWQDNRSGAWKLYFTALDQQGNKIATDNEVSDVAGVTTNLSASIVWNGSDYGITWDDDRAGNNEIYFNRLDNSGDSLISDLRLTNSAGSSDRPWITWSTVNSEYGVVWNEDISGNTEIYFTRVNSAGVEQGTDIRITTAAGSSSAASIISNGSGYGISWTDNRDGDAETFFTTVNATGTKLLGDLNISNDGIQSSCPVLAWTGTEYGLAWYEIANITFVRLNTSGVIQGSPLEFGSGNSYFPYLIWTGTEYGISYEINGGGIIRFSRINTNSEKIGGDTDFSEDGWGYPTCVWTGTDYAVTYDTGGEIYFVTLTADGIVK